jgi:two-component system, OmpR family, sensor kinase
VLSLRARVLVGAAVIALVLAVGAVVTIRTTRQHLLEQVDDRLLATNARDLGFGPGPGGPPRFSELYVGVVQGDGVRTVLASNPAGDENPRPEIDVDALRSDRLFTVRAESGDLRYRVRTISLGRGGGTGVLALPLDTVDDATGRLLAVAVGTTAVALGVVALVAWWVVHLGVRPIKRMTAAASAIAAGNLSQRVPEPAAGTEAGDLAQALNTMLGRIEEAFDERTRSEERLRQFVADASHELRTPVTTIRGYAELYRGGGLDDPTELEEAMRRTEQESVRMGRLVDDLLQLARLDQGRPLVQQPVDLAAVVAEVVIPHVVEDLGLRQHPPLVHEQVAQEVVLRRRQRHGLPGACDAMGVVVHLEVGAAQHLPVVLRQPRPPQDGLDPGDELLEAEGLHEVVVAAEGEATHLVLGGVAGGEEQHRHA